MRTQSTRPRFTVHCPACGESRAVSQSCSSRARALGESYLCRACDTLRQRTQARTNRDRSRTIRPARWATDAQPGSPEKIRVMAARVAAGEAVFHPDDARLS